MREVGQMSVDRFELAKTEYIKLKDEQTKRIGFRDNLLYVNLVLIAGIMSFAFTGARDENQWRLHGLLIVGWTTLILGWTYVVNDEKISAIGRYIRESLTPELDLKPPETQLFGWERAHRSDRRRRRRKIEQLVIDELSFPGLGLGAIFLFLTLPSHSGLVAQSFGLLEAVLLVILGIEVLIYADLAGGPDA
jgi:hypothetical protein